ncbi:MAG: FHA domain-containing serine/threonine-protein kinase [Algoriphagus sp.]|uniref:FHA domain-containing serine/threonine-protein kinase n=1 Tax=Algoriphagus sp. TaxID=1872435 RepID=UPI002605FF89|nr:FHA domain-containing serine/threonine-protein kinase [Algoriphagus sp.]MDG1279304.1 FHA domain-containing serine/threonine-protein kinase [Algoriphagus sp.]
MEGRNIQVLDLKPGVIFPSPDGDFLLDKELGEGGFGSVYKASNHFKEVAIKIVKLWKMMPDNRVEFEKRLKQEFEISKSIKSPHIIVGYHFDYLQGNPFIIMEFCGGGSLRDQFSKMDITKVNRFALQILKGLTHLHEQGIIHRDIKPENILLDKEHNIKLVDFGISGSIKKRQTQLDIMGRVKEVFATVTYSPPEQTDAVKAFKSMGPTNDIYSFGVTMYEFFTQGLLPFGPFDAFQNNFSDYENRKKKNDWDKKTLQKVIQENHLWFEIIEKCLNPKPEDRYQSCSQVLEALGYSKSEINRPYKINYPETVSWGLQVMQGDEIGRIYNLSKISKILRKGFLRLGWFDIDDPFKNDIGLVEVYTKYISSRHATLYWNEKSNYWSIMDGQFVSETGPLKTSKNGVLVNGEKLKTPLTLNEGSDSLSFDLIENDIITIGDTTLKVLVLSS